MTLFDHLAPTGPKRILTLDGGGIRGALSLGFLERIEMILQQRHGRDTLRLCDYFDLIVGTSTGAIIAAGLAIGLTVKQIREEYLQLGGVVFGRKQWLPWNARYDAGPLREELHRIFGDRTLGDASVETGLGVIVKRADTRSTWPLLNHPDSKYYQRNKAISLHRAVRASTAAPTYFEPEAIDVGNGEVGAFVDGGVSMANNPALLALLVATLKGFPFRWATGADRLLLVSVGTGIWHRRDPVAAVTDSRLWDWAREVPAMLMDDANWHGQLLLQYLSRTPTHWTINREIGDLADDLLTPEPVLSYLRYNALLEANTLNELGLARLVPKLESLRDMSAAENRQDLLTIGRATAAKAVSPDHFPRAFDLAA